MMANPDMVSLAAQLANDPRLRAMLRTMPESERAGLDATIAALRADLARVKAGGLYRGDRRRVEDAFFFSNLLLDAHIEGRNTSRRDGPLTIRQWRAARALLRAADLWRDGCGIVGGLAVGEYHTRLNRAYRRACTDPGWWRRNLDPYDANKRWAWGSGHNS